MRQSMNRLAWWYRHFGSGDVFSRRPVKLRAHFARIAHRDRRMRVGTTNTLSYKYCQVFTSKHICVSMNWHGIEQAWCLTVIEDKRCDIRPLRSCFPHGRAASQVAEARSTGTVYLSCCHSVCRFTTTSHHLFSLSFSVVTSFLSALTLTNAYQKYYPKA